MEDADVCSVLDHGELGGRNAMKLEPNVWRTRFGERGTHSFRITRQIHDPPLRFKASSLYKHA
jgi:hypothetical protein